MITRRFGLACALAIVLSAAGCHSSGHPFSFSGRVGPFSVTVDYASLRLRVTVVSVDPGFSLPSSGEFARTWVRATNAVGHTIGDWVRIDLSSSDGEARGTSKELAFPGGAKPKDIKDMHVVLYGVKDGKTERFGHDIPH